MDENTPSTTTKPCCSFICWSTASPLLIIVQSMLHIGQLQIFLFLKHCPDFDPGSFSTYVYVTYFYDSNQCGHLNNTAIFPEDFELVQEIQLPDVGPWTKANRILMSVQCSLDFLWLLISFAIVIGACIEHSRKTELILNLIFVVTGFVTTLFDLFIINFYSKKYRKWTNGAEWLEFIGAENVEEFTQMNDFEEQFDLVKVVNVLVLFLLVMNRFLVFSVINFMILFAVLIYVI